MLDSITIYDVYVYDCLLLMYGTDITYVTVYY